MSHLALLGLLALLLTAVGVVGVVVPVLPGSLFVALGLLVWAISLHRALGWATLAVGGVLVLVGSATGTLLTRRRLVQRSVPQWITVASACGALVGSFVLPGPGLVLGFVITLLAIELARVRHLRAALATTWSVLKAVGAGLLVELGCDLLATSALVVSVWFGVHSA